MKSIAPVTTPCSRGLFFRTLSVLSSGVKLHIYCVIMTEKTEKRDTFVACSKKDTLYYKDALSETHE
jgi:hypothetical protein